MWKECYDLFVEKAETLCKTFGICDVELPKFTQEEVNFLNEYCKSDSNFNYFLKAFYMQLYDLIEDLEKGKKITAENLLNTGCDFGRIKQTLLNYAELKGEPEGGVVDNIIDKYFKTRRYIATVVETMEAKRR